LSLALLLVTFLLVDAGIATYLARRFDY
jgi:hypothetical protein